VRDTESVSILQPYLHPVRTAFFAVECKVISELLHCTNCQIRGRDAFLAVGSRILSGIPLAPDVNPAVLSARSIGVFLAISLDSHSQT
jgi:hypothetical protein